MAGNAIRLSGSWPVIIKQKASTPPSFLYHGTLREHVESIRQQGLLKQNLHYVHLSSASAHAMETGARRGSDVALVVVNAGLAENSGVNFYRVANCIWVTEFVSPEFLTFV
jgi:putative RNA 2'-phosphotransferase